MREIKVLILILLVLFGITVMRSVLLPLYAEIDYLENESRKILTDIKEMEKNEGQKKQDNDKDLATMIPGEFQLIQLYSYIDDAIDECEIFLLNASLSDQQKMDGENGLIKNTLDITVQGNLNDLIDLMESLEANPRLSILSSVSLAEARFSNNNKNIDDEELIDFHEIGIAEQSPERNAINANSRKVFTGQIKIDSFYLPES